MKYISYLLIYMGIRWHSASSRQRDKYAESAKKHLVILFGAATTFLPEPPRRGNRFSRQKDITLLSRDILIN